MTIQNNIYHYFAANPDLHVLFVFDPQGDIRTELDSASWNEGYRYVVFDGAWFAAKYAIANDWASDKVILLMPFSRPESNAEMLNFPLLNVLKSNMEYLTESYEVFLQQHNLSGQFRAFVQRHIEQLQLEKYNQILEPYYNSPLFSTDMAFRGLISGFLAETKLLEWNEIALRLFMLPSGDPKRSKAFYNALQNNDDVLQIINAKFLSMFGQSLDMATDNQMRLVALSVKYNAITQLLTVVEADNYKGFKISSQGCLNQINDFMAKAIALPRNRREQFFEVFDRLASEIRIPDIIANYGIDANYFYIPKDLCWEILKVIIVNHLATNPNHALKMLYNLQLKQENHEDIQNVIRFCINVANYYDIKHGLSTLIFNTPDDYIDLYVNTFYLIDQSYRKALEEWQSADYDAPVKEAMDESKRILDEDYAKLANQFNANWLHCLTETNSDFFSLSVNRQQDFYKKEVVAQTKQVVIISDALRYEVAVDLLNALMRGKKYEVSLTHALAMLPTETKYCKPSLLPHNDLKVYADANGMSLSVDGKNLSAIDKRTEHLQLFKPDAECVDFKQVMNGTKAENRELFKKSLVYIYHQTVDEAGHSNDPVSVIKACSRAVEELALLVSRLQNNFAVVNVTITADHGFLYNDRRFEDKDKQTIVEDTLEKSTRYYITQSDAAVTNVVKFPINKVSSMQSDVFVAVPTGTNRFAIQGGGYNFVHGGASLQELVIPVISSHFNRTKEKQPVGVTLVSKNLNMVSSRLRVQLIQSEAVSADFGIREITVAVYAADKPVTNVVALTLDNASVLASDRITTIDLTLCVSVASSLLQLRVLDVKHPLNPLIVETVTNNTLIETDF